MLELSKTIYRADIDAAWETVDFLRANVQNMLAMYDPRVPRPRRVIESGFPIPTDIRREADAVTITVLTVNMVSSSDSRRAPRTQMTDFGSGA